MRRLPKIIVVNLAVLVGLYILTEAVLHVVSSGSNPLFPKSPLRIRDPAYTHTLKSNFAGYDWWMGRKYPVFTNSLGFRDASVRDVPLDAGRKRILFMGNSVTEGVGVAYEETFVGRIARAVPEADILNAAVESYAPSAYYEKLKYYIGAGLKFDEAIVYVDISDMQDEATPSITMKKVCCKCRYQTNARRRFCRERPAGRRFLYRRFRLSILQISEAALCDQPRHFEFFSHGDFAYSREWGRGAWTYDNAPTCFGSLGVEGAIVKARWQMDRLHELLSAWNRVVGRCLSMAATVALRYRQFTASSDLARLVCWKMQAILRSFSRLLSLQGKRSRLREKLVHLGGHSLQSSRPPASSGRFYREIPSVTATTLSPICFDCAAPFVGTALVQSCGPADAGQIPNGSNARARAPPLSEGPSR